MTNEQNFKAMSFIDFLILINKNADIMHGYMYSEGEGPCVKELLTGNVCIIDRESNDCDGFGNCRECIENYLKESS